MSLKESGNNNNWSKLAKIILGHDDSIPLTGMMLMNKQETIIYDDL